MRYPIWGTAIAVLSLASAFYYATYESSADNYVTLAAEFVIAFVITFAGWYALVLLVGWAWEPIQRARGVRMPDATENRRAVAGLPGLLTLTVEAAGLDSDDLARILTDVAGLIIIGAESGAIRVEGRKVGAWSIGGHSNVHYR